jgi:hypothetical protein
MSTTIFSKTFVISLALCSNTLCFSGEKTSPFPKFIAQDPSLQVTSESPPPAAPPAPKKLGFFDQWRYDSCRQDAAKATTEIGVRVGLRVCHEKFLR